MKKVILLVVALCVFSGCKANSAKDESGGGGYDLVKTATDYIITRRSAIDRPISRYTVDPDSLLVVEAYHYD